MDGRASPLYLEEIAGQSLAGSISDHEESKQTVVVLQKRYITLYQLHLPLSAFEQLLPQVKHLLLNFLDWRSVLLPQLLNRLGPYSFGRVGESVREGDVGFVD